jgi:ER membrane protein complex subunit 10
MKSLFVVWTVASFVLSSNASNLYHRVWNPADKPPPFTLRGNLRTNEDSTLAFVGSDDFETVVSNLDFPDNTLYQIALEREGDSFEKDWDISSVKAVRTLST